MGRNMENFKINISDALELPLDIALDLPKITIIGDLKVDIQNHKGIIEYTSNLIRINSKIGVIKIIGEKLEIKNILSEEINVNGKVEKLEIIN